MWTSVDFEPSCNTMWKATGRQRTKQKGSSHPVKSFEMSFEKPGELFMKTT